MKTIKNKSKNGSVLVFTLIIMSVMLLMAISIASVTMIERKMSGSTGKSNQAFQVADSGVEIVVNKKKNAPTDAISNLGSCNSGTVNIGSVVGGNATVTFYADDVGTKLSCSDPISKTFKIKSAGVFSATVRAVEVEIASLSCDPPTVSYEGKNYTTVQIGTQCWFKENLNVGTLVAGSDNQGTSCSSIQKYCYSDTESICTTDGGIYQWNQAMCGSTTPGAQGICPTGWHIPTDTEQYTLENYLKTSGQTCSATRNGTDCSDAGTKLKTGGSSGFNALLAGDRDLDGSLYNRVTFAYFWSSSAFVASNAWARDLYSGHATVHRYYYDKAYGFSVRCLKN